MWPVSTAISNAVEEDSKSSEGVAAADKTASDLAAPAFSSPAAAPVAVVSALEAGARVSLSPEHPGWVRWPR
jgi:hypothetical protein